MLDRLEAIEERYEELNHLLVHPEVLADQERWQDLSREYATLQEVIPKYREYKRTVEERERVRSMLDEGLDSEMMIMAQQESAMLQVRCHHLIEELRLILSPKDIDGDKDVIMEIRAGTGGKEAALFAADLFRMYARFAQAKGWEVEIMDSNESSKGGFKEVIFEVRGKGVFGRLKYERGVHRVQRIPVTEASGRIHTSTATVAVLPEAEEVEVHLNPEDLKIEFFHSGGPGGQNVNKVATAVRIIHLPTGIMVTCQDERSQLRNRMKAMRVLRARFLDREQRKQQEEVSRERRSQVGSGERAEKIRTYNFPQDRVTDHRIGLTFHNLPAILEGKLDQLIEALAAQELSHKDNTI
jgi:peptide chain release factor 1